MNLPLHNFLSEQMGIIKYSTWNLADISFLLSSSSFALSRLSSCKPQRLGSTQNNSLFSACHRGLVQHKTTLSSCTPQGLGSTHTLSSCTPQGLGSTQNNTHSPPAHHRGLVQHKTTHTLLLHTTGAWFNTKQHSPPAHHRGLVQHKTTHTLLLHTRGLVQHKTTHSPSGQLCSEENYCCE